MNARLRDIIRKLASERQAASLSAEDLDFLGRLVAADQPGANADAPRPLWSHFSRRAMVFGMVFEPPGWDTAVNKLYAQAGMSTAGLSYEDNNQRWVIPVQAADLRRACAWALQQDDGELRLQGAVHIAYAGFEDLLQPLLDELESGRGERNQDAGGRVAGALQALAMFEHPRTAALALAHVDSEDYRIRTAAKTSCVLCSSQLEGDDIERVFEHNFEPWELSKAPQFYVEAARRGGFSRERLEQVVQNVHLSVFMVQHIAEMVVAAGWEDTFVELIGHDDADLRAAIIMHAAWGDAEFAKDKLRERLDEEDADEPKMVLIAALGSFGTAYDDVIDRMLEDGSGHERTGAIWGVIGRPEYAARVRLQLGHDDELVRMAAACVLAALDGDAGAMELAWNALLNRDDWWPWALGLRALEARGVALPTSVRGFNFVSEQPRSLAVVDEAVAFFAEHPAELMRWIGRDGGDTQRARALQYAGMIGGDLMRSCVEQALAITTTVDDACKATRELAGLGGPEHPIARLKAAISLSQSPTLGPDDITACVALATAGTNDLHARATAALGRFGEAGEPWIAQLLFHEDNDINNAATEAITRLHTPSDPLLRDASSLLDGSVRRIADLETLPRLFNCPARRIREALAEAAGRPENPPEEVVRMLLRLGVDKEASVVTAATASLANKLPDAPWIKQLLLRNSRAHDWQLTRGMVATMAQIGDPVFVPRLVELAVGDDESHKDAAVRGLERVAERFAALGLIVLDIRDPYRLATRYGIADQIDHSADRHSEALRLLMLALDRKRSAERAVAENHRKVMLTPLSADAETTQAEGGWDQATFEQLALYLSVTFVDEDTGTVIAEVTTEPTGEVLSALLQTRTVCATTIAWS